MGKISKPLAEEIEPLGRENQRRQAGEAALHGSCSLRIFRPFSRAAFNCVPRSFCGSPCFQQRRNTRQEIETAQPPSPGCNETLSPAAEKSGSGPFGGRFHKLLAIRENDDSSAPLQPVWSLEKEPNDQQQAVVCFVVLSTREWPPACHRFATGNAARVHPFVAHCPITTLPLLRALHCAAPAPPWPW
ncbi:predicted protein [Chaetomium globosum CBS 148.51]|uniref:Uncharacterized protein n=1 Tax=Chaetomium globosum (strain ATCC 6205 / CBS 148.51 / DSM 1962 / NBRC 6347 / NRRL 1970) TaxID=306901 RepID=Q2HGL0_CHAGB|nr:uncharacterized protein CHGG_00644 [Chaetomium globosum CBS 148.51]EAQ92409.1 predicted protein [Chaetomium globosum CBS 148.51]